MSASSEQQQPTNTTKLEMPDIATMPNGPRRDDEEEHEAGRRTAGSYGLFQRAVQAQDGKGQHQEAQ